MEKGWWITPLVIVCAAAPVVAILPPALTIFIVMCAVLVIYGLDHG